MEKVEKWKRKREDGETMISGRPQAKTGKKTRRKDPPALSSTCRGVISRPAESAPAERAGVKNVATLISEFEAVVFVCQDEL